MRSVCQTRRSLAQPRSYPARGQGEAVNRHFCAAAGFLPGGGPHQAPPFSIVRGVFMFKKRNSHRLFPWTAGIFLLAFSWLGAQQTTGTISGRVTDTTGAVIPGVEVTIANEQTGVRRTVVTNDAGLYTATQLPVGIYSVSASLTGFKRSEHSGIQLHVREEKVVDIVLEVGEVTETVTVQGGATEVELRSGEVSTLIQEQQVRELPLNGRSFVQLTLLVPGASVANNANTRNTGLLASVDISMSGSPANANMWLVDGVDNVDHGSGRTILVYPSVDSIAEFKVQRNSYGPEMSASGGAQINLVTKSGTNEFHGSVYEFFRNDSLNATNFFLNRGGEKKGKLRYNNFGYTVGGPIARDRAFFFWSQEWRVERRGVTRVSTVPTELERKGDFSGPHSGDWPTPLDPMTGQPFPGNRIPADRLSPAGLALMNLWPLPTNKNTVNNWVAAPVTPIDTRQEQIRVDTNITEDMSLMVRYTQDSWTNNNPNFGAEGGLWGDEGLPPVDSDWDQPSKLLGVQLTNVLGPDKVNQFQFSYSNNRIFITRGIGEEINADINSKIPEVFPGPDSRSHAVFWGAPLPNQPFNALWHAAPWDNAHDIFTWKDDFSWIQGNHSFKMGGLFGYFKKDEDCCGASSNQAQFWGTTAVPGGAGVGGGWGDANAPGNGGIVTGNGVADLLLRGTYWGGNEQSDQPRAKIRWRDIEAYFGDTWRVTPRLTFNYGFRWSYLPQSWQDDDQMSNFVPSLYDPARGDEPTNGLIFPGDTKGIDVGRALRRNNVDIPAPRLGIAWDPTGQGKWAIRAGYGWFFGRADLSQPIGQMILNPPFNKSLNWPAGRPLDFLPANIPTAGVGTATQGAALEYKTQGSYQWNLTIERELWRDTKIELAYIGNRGHHLPYNINLNYVPSNLRLEYARRNFAPDSAGLGNPDELRLLFPLKGGNDLIFLSNGGNSIYHGFQLFLTKRFADNFSYQLAYSGSKLLSLTALSCCGGGGELRITDPENFGYDRARAPFDRTHIVTANAIYRFSDLDQQSPAVRALLGSWELTGIYSYSTGVPITPTLSGANLVGTGAGGSANRPDLVGNPKGPQTAEQWLNPNAFVFPRQLGRLGLSPKGSVRAPAINNLDFAIYKNFPLGREQMALQFRAEFFNVFNHTQFVDVDTSYNVGGLEVDLQTNQFVACSTGRFPDCNTNAQFGKVTRARDAREIQFALKFLF